MKNLKHVCKQRTYNMIKKTIGNPRFFSEQVKVDRNEYKDDVKFEENDKIKEIVLR